MIRSNDDFRILDPENLAATQAELEGEFEVTLADGNSIKVETVFTALQKLLVDYDLAKVAAITGLDPVQIEQALIDFLADQGVTAERRAGAPGVYVGAAKIAALGLKIKNGCSYHGLSLNVDMDLSPFAAINPCGYAGLAVTQTTDLGIPLTPDQAGELLCRHLQQQLDKPHG